MGFSGDLSSFSLSDVFQTLANNQQTGTLRIHDEHTEKNIFFSQGSIRTVSTGKSRCALLGEILLARGKLTFQQLQTVLTIKKDNKDKLTGEIMVEEEICSREDVETALRFQMEEEIYDLFNWKNARFQFNEGSFGTVIFGRRSRISEIQMNVTSLMMEAARRLDEWDRIRSQLPSFNMAPVLQVNPDDIPELGDEQRNILNLCDGSHTINQIARKSCAGSYVASQVISTHLDAGNLRDATAEELLTHGEELLLQGEPASAAPLYSWLLKRDGENYKLRQSLIEALEGAGQFEEAANNCRIAARTEAKASRFANAIKAYKHAGKLTTLTGSDMDQLAELYLITNREKDAANMWLTRARTLFDHKKNKAALSICEKALEYVPESEDIHSLKARMHLEEGESHKAVETYEKLAAIFTKKTNIKAALSTYRSILRLDASRKDIQEHIESLQIRNTTQMRRKRYKAVTPWLIAALLLIPLIAIGMEIKARNKFNAMQEKSNILLKANPEKQKLKQQFALIKNLNREWKAFDPGFSISNLSSQIEIEQKKVKQWLAQLSTEKNKFDSALLEQDQILFEAALLLLCQAEDSKKRKQGLNELALLSKNLPGNQWTQKAAEELRKNKQARKKAAKLFAELKGKKPAERFSLVKTLIKNYPNSESAFKVSLPVEIRVDPALPVNIYLNGTQVDKLSGKAQGIWLELSARKNSTLSVFRPGFGKNKGKTVWNITSKELLALAKPLKIIKLQRIAKWKKQLKQSCLSAPLIAKPEARAKEMVYIATLEGDVFAFALDTGFKLWHFRGSQQRLAFRSSPYLYKNKLYLLDSEGKLVCLDALKGKLVWSSKGLDINNFAGNITTPALFETLPFYKNKLFCLAGTSDGKIICLRTDNGELRWPPYDTSSSRALVFAGIFSQGNLFFSTSNGSIHILRSDGKKLALCKPHQPVTAQPVIINNVLYIYTEDGVISAWDVRHTPKQIWETSPKQGDVRTPALLIGKKLYFGTANGNVLALRNDNGQMLWHKEFGAAINLPLVQQDDNLLLARGNKLVALAYQGKGDINWQYQVGENLLAGFSTSSKNIAIVDETGKIHVLDIDRDP